MPVRKLRGPSTGAPSYVLLKEGEMMAHGTGPIREFLDSHL